MAFLAGYLEKRDRLDSDYCFVFSGEDLFLHNDSVPSFDYFEEVLKDKWPQLLTDLRFFGSIDEHSCYSLSIESGLKGLFQNDAVSDSSGCGFISLRSYLMTFGNDIGSAAAYAKHLLYWDLNSRFCGSCGGKNNWHQSECAKICSDCGSVTYPRISPAIIIMVKKDNKILLAHNRRFPKGRYSVLAGFMEIGETLEETAAREVREECGIEIKNIEFVSSQSWPFPDSLMLGLTADWASGEISPDGIEIEDAGWFNPETRIQGT